MARFEDLENAGFRIKYDDAGAPVDIVDSKGASAGFALVKRKTLTGRIDIPALAGTNVLRNSVPFPSALATSDLYIRSIDNAGITLPNPYESIGKAHAPVHPGAITFDATWNGYKHWLAYTPYPAADSAYENPCVAASNDGVEWVAMGPQPLVIKPANGYNADGHLFMSPDGVTMYMVFRERLPAIDVKNNLKVMHTTDGKTWSAPVTIMQGTHGTQDFASPSIWWNGTGWTLIAHNLDGASPYPVQRYVSSTADVYGAWGAASTVTIPAFGARQWWHSFHVRMSSGQIIALFQDNPSSGQPGFVYWAESADDGATYTVTGHAMAGAGASGATGIRGYRSAFSIEQTPDGPNVNVYLGDLQGFKIMRHVARQGYQKIKAEYAARHAAYLAQGTTLAPDVQWADNFNRADSATVIGTASSGGTYTVASGTWGIRSNQAYAVASGKVLAAGTTNNHEIQSRISQVTSNIQQWIVGRSVDSSNCWRMGTYSNAAGLSILVLQTVVAGAIALNKEVGVINQGDILALRFSGVTVEVIVNGVVQHTEVSSVHLAGTSYGLQSNAGATSNYDSLVCLKV